jgi:hypothetical protein
MAMIPEIMVAIMPAMTRGVNIFEPYFLKKRI